MLTQERLKQLLHYDPDTGVFTGNLTNRKVGSVSDRGYLRLNLQNRLYMAHRIAWLYMTGDFPEREIDHIDGDKLNNRWVNLRPATRKQNMENTSLFSTSTSGYRGVTWYKRNNKWGATAFHNGKRHFAGLFDTAEEAAVAAKQLRDELFTHHLTSHAA
jgi:hypothetical protein